MGLLQRFFGGTPAAPQASSGLPVVQSGGGSGVFLDLSDPRVTEFLRGSLDTASGLTVTTDMALRNPTVFRCMDLICGSVAMLPLKVHRELPGGGVEVAKNHSVHRILRRRPNSWQTPFEFKGLMQYRALTHRMGAVAMIVRSGRRILEVLPLNPDRVDIALTDDLTVRYFYNRKGGGRIELRPEEVFHLRGLTFDGVHAVARVEKAAEAIAISIQAERATAALFKNGTFASGALKLPHELSEEAYERLKVAWAERHAGPGNAGNTPILEGGTEYQAFAQTARESQTVESRRFQVEEILRVFGVPRPLAMMDDTGWGSGIEQLSIGFVRYGLNPWFTAWQEACARSFLTDDEDDHEIKFNPAALLNGTMKDQADFFAKASGAGGHRPWMTPNEIRAKLNEPPHPDGDTLQPVGGAPAPAEDTATDDAADRSLAGRKPVESEDD